MGAIFAGMKTIPEDTFLISAENLAKLVTDKDLDSGNLYPPLQDIQKCSLEIAIAVMDYAYNECKFYIFKLCYKMILQKIQKCIKYCFSTRNASS